MTTRRFHPTSFWVQSITDNQWAGIERAGLISLSSTQRQFLQSAYEEFQQHRALASAGASLSAVKKTLLGVQARVEDGRAALSQLLGDETLNQVALYELRQRLALNGYPSPDRAEISTLCGQLRRIAGAASMAVEKMPSAGRGATSTRWVDDFFEKADRAFEEAGGRKKLRAAYMKALRDAVGYTPKSTETTFMRKADKARRRNSAS